MSLNAQGFVSFFSHVIITFISTYLIESFNV
jgi:hypothetical protein